MKYHDPNGPLVAHEPVQMSLLVCRRCADEWTADAHDCETHVLAPAGDVIQCECLCGMPDVLETWREWLRRQFRRCTPQVRRWYPADREKAG